MTRNGADTRPLVAVTMGDPAGVGPEVVVRALAAEKVQQGARALVIGDRRFLEQAAQSAGLALHAETVTDAETCTSSACVLDLENADPHSLPVGELSRAAGLAARQYIEEGAKLALAGQVDGVVTAPINKEALRLAGIQHPGHTEMLAALCGSDEVAMMLVHGSMRVSHVTTHVALREACNQVKRARVLEVVRLTARAVRSMVGREPVIAVAGLNPHAGESGLFGREEIEEIQPAVEAARSEGIDAVGPLPPDTVFARHRAGEFDAVVAMTHDQGHIAVKTVGFVAENGGDVGAADRGGKGGRQADDTKPRLRSSGVNVTLGLPIIRTSVDHGTAFDIAGRGLADETSMVEAILLAAAMARDRRNRKT
ncbi:MAG: 4-hydroxythreonine-4-phosphate dehydrogenase PdxA [Armatimonadetes bacterium]|nr:4-hydroxythreonine-4-phosphate dehydrogenase PdxA [Armatimonadota bacterium]